MAKYKAGTIGAAECRGAKREDGEVLGPWAAWRRHVGLVFQTDASDAQLRDFCQGQIAHFKIPEYVWLVDECPMTVTGKLQKFRMREIAMEKLAQ